MATEPNPPPAPVAAAPEIFWDRTGDGWVAFNGPLKVAVMSTRHNQGLVREGRVIMEPMDPSTWALWFTSPAIKVDVIKAILASLPTEA